MGSRKKVYVKPSDITQETVKYASTLVGGLIILTRDSMEAWKIEPTGNQPNNILVQLEDWLVRYKAGLKKAQNELDDLKLKSMSDAIPDDQYVRQ